MIFFLFCFFTVITSLEEWQERVECRRAFISIYFKRAWLLTRQYMSVHVQSKKYQERVFSLTLHVLKYFMTFAPIFSEHLLKTNTHMRTHPLFSGLQTAKGYCGNNGVCLKKHTILCRLSLDMETTAICGLKGRAQQFHTL